MLRRFDDPAVAGRLREGLIENLRKRGGPTKLLIVEGKYAKRALEDVARELRQDPVNAAISVIRLQDPRTVSFNQSEADIAAFMRRPWVMTSSDASVGHPRVYGSFARMPELEEEEICVVRGRLAPGYAADVVVFDPKRYAERATYEQPTLLAEGVRAVVVNGVLAVDQGKLTGRAAGRALKHRPTPGSCR